jgi:mxaJ protein
LCLRFLGEFVFVALLCWPAHAGEQPFAVCADPENLPYSSRDKGGFELEAARLLAEDVGRKLEIVWVAQRTPDFLRATILAGKCNAVMSVPSAFKSLATTDPWYRSSFTFVTRQDRLANLRDFDDPRLRQLRVGVAVAARGIGTPPSIALLKRGISENVRSYSLLDSSTLIDDLSVGTLDVAIAWGPFAGWYAHEAALKQEAPTLLSISPIAAADHEIPLVFEISIGLKKSDFELRKELDLAIDRNRSSIQAILDRWHIPRAR